MSNGVRCYSSVPDTGQGLSKKVSESRFLKSTTGFLGSKELRSQGERRRPVWTRDRKRSFTTGLGTDWNSVDSLYKIFSKDVEVTGREKIVPIRNYYPYT